MFGQSNGEGGVMCPWGNKIKAKRRDGGSFEGWQVGDKVNLQACTGMIIIEGRREGRIKQKREKERNESIEGIQERKNEERKVQRKE